jgi:hypothetical protein
LNADRDPWASMVERFEQLSSSDFDYGMSASIVPRLFAIAAVTLHEGQYIDIFFSISITVEKMHSKSEAFQRYIKPMDAERSARLALANPALQIMYDWMCWIAVGSTRTSRR